MTASESRGRSPLDRPALVLLVATILMLAVDAWVLATVSYRSSVITVVRESLFVAAWIGVGVVALRVRRSFLARRILALTLVLAANFVGSARLVSEAIPIRALDTLVAILVPLQVAFTAHLLASYPSGRLKGPGERRLVSTAYVVGGLQGLWWAFAVAGPDDCVECTRHLVAIEITEPVDRAVTIVFVVAWVILAAGLVAILVARYRRAGRRERRLLRLPYLSIAVSATLYAALTVTAAMQGERSPWLVSTGTLAAFQLIVLLGIPLSILVSLLHERLAYRPIGELVVELAGGTDTDLERSLAVALRDPELSIAFPIDGGFVDSHGRLVPRPEPDGRTTVTPVSNGDGGTPLALIRHDRSLDDEPALLTAAGSATRLILENTRLQAEVRAQLMQVRESRTRIVTATDAARARLERDLHDGAQQRLLAIGIALQLLRQQPGDAALLEAAESELASALAELRDLAAGIHPAVLTDLGLLAALEDLVARLGERVRLEIASPIPRCAAATEAAAYFATSEAITNALKHAAPSPVLVSVAQDDGRLMIRVSDEGPGEVDPNGTGILGIRDRLATADGALIVDSPPGGGTRLTLEVPCA
ncbi:sensor histidine kinase [Agromyces sp. SYSU T00266]|uniref:sensor histidine kinase n=1 Tax=Agromyces zhanjiangensis TaxID=3158562 RepID=UPI00339A66E8